MKCISFDRDVIDIHFEKIEKIYLDIGGDPLLKKAIVSSLSKMLVGNIMMIMEEKFKSITIP